MTATSRGLALGLVFGVGALCGCGGGSTPDGGTTGGTTGGGTSGGGSTGGAGTGTTGAGSNSLQGSGAFTVTSALTLPALCNACGSGDGGPQATFVLLSDQNLSPEVCGAQDGGVDGITHLLNIQLAAAGYVACAETNGIPAPATITPPATFPILNEGVDDEDICGNIPASDTAALAILSYEVCGDGGMSCGAPFWAQAGSVTLTSLTVAGAAGSFDVFLGNGAGGLDAGELTGTFGTLACPGG